MQSYRFTSLIGFLITSVLLYVSAAVGQKPATPKVDFTKDVLPILKASCFQCHGPESQAAGLRLDLPLPAMKGGISGKAITSGDGAHSLLIQRIEGKDGKPRMPLGFAPLAPQQIATLKAWIDAGAQWPASFANLKHWAYVKPIRRTPPKVKLANWVRNPIDNFVLAKLEANSLKPSPEATKETLIRRVTLDLIGLPPTVEEVAAFLADKSPNAYEKVVDRLLASPRYGERWARPWLDLARYADTNGYEKDSSRSIWPYRDWVINALNRDMPFDEFTIEQIAGDILPGATQEQKIATGFHRNTMTNEEGGVDRGEQRWLTQVDRVGTTGSVWLGSTLACAQCHNHKYDPFSQKEFYQMLAFFENCQEPAFEVTTPDSEAKRKALQDEIDQREKFAQLANMPAEAGKKLAAEITDLKKQLATLHGPTTLIFHEEPGGKTPTTVTRIKGAYLSPGEQVEAATPAFLLPMPKDKPRNRLGLAYWLIDENNPLTARVAVNRFWEHYFGHGIVETSEDFGTQGQKPSHPELLDWLATEFMGAQYGAKAAPQWAKKWGMKAIHRLIVTSATYRQASRLTPALLEKDPSNKWLARGPRFRLEAEMLRDNALAIGGLLSPKIGGPSVFPLQPDGIWDIPYSGETWNTSQGEDRYRRGLYTFWRRSAPYPSFLTFDATSRESCTVRRIRTNTPLQALTILNDPAFLDAAHGLVEQMRQNGGATVESQITYAFRRATARKPKPTELTRLLALYNKEKTRYIADTKAAQSMSGAKAEDPNLTEKAALTIVANVLLNLDETLTKE